MRAIKSVSNVNYSKLNKIDGRHPLKGAVPEAYIEYPARIRKDCKVTFFNFDLAKEMGLIPDSHPSQLNPELERVILDNFGIVIINEYDQIHGLKVPSDELKPYTYMATKYLQLQHPGRTGKTSGDGRSVWYGQVENKGQSWDISASGVGATSLSPATHIYKKYFKTGDPSISYGCGCAEAEEGFATLFFSEILHRNNIKTERVLAVLEYGKGLSINVRAYPNLLRPSHFFNHLKQGNWETLKQITDFYIHSEEKAGRWKDVPKKLELRYKYFLQKISEAFSTMSARFEDDYIFCWLDWDGDNILMDGGIVDYGSIRQFGLFHHEYRYDDVERYSTNIVEQKLKARYIVQTFAQIIDFLLTKEKKALDKFRNHWTVKSFDEHFELLKDKHLLEKIGLRDEHQEYLLKKNRKLVNKMRMTFSYFERAKSSRGLVEIPDGITWDAIFCMRDLMREYPQIQMGRESFLTPKEFVQIIKSNYARPSDLKVSPYRAKQVQLFQNYYKQILEIVGRQFKIERKKLLLEISMRSSVINKYDRVTGDSVSHIVSMIYKKRKELGHEQLYELLQHLKIYQDLNPDHLEDKKALQKAPKQQKLWEGMISVVRDCREGL